MNRPSKPLSIAHRDHHFATIVQHSFDAIVSKDVDGTVQSWNPAAERIFGWTAAEMIGRSIRVLIPPDRQHEEDDILRRIRAGEMVPKFETERLHKSGRRIHVAVTVSPLRDTDGRIVGASKIAHDITDTMEIRRRLIASEHQFRTLANSIPQLAWIADSDGTVFWYNDRWFDYTGTTLEQMQGEGWTKVHHPDHFERVSSRLKHSWDTGEEWEDTFPLRGKDGEYRWFLSRAMPLRDHTGQVWRWFGTNTDITVQRQHEQQIQMLMGEVNHRAKNMLAVVQAMVMRTADRSFAESLGARLQALSRNQDLLIKRNWSGTPIGELIESQLAAVNDLIGTRVLIEGDRGLLLSPVASETIGLAIHELTTNATKYGALSNADGTVQIACNLREAVDGRKLDLVWREQGGPPVGEPNRAGFGTVMIDRNPRATLGADVEISYPESGLRWRLTAPLDRLVAEP
ncbi:PAS domain S-box-containing protein [Rhodopseudomonas thermotolerans]|uniref:Blue-light-activated histidine kinase n=2 Tax=Rhodopseudomonas TaxID=1073 RepID=A0A336JM50_9BRAD|nr:MULTISPECIES: PAS domain S-box protein [Rhodopseudomonas]RED38440.1 PAS domain S-box-containing protein [Rhodopseudomonas pentothenatexigens]REG06025.1 PAS domain S-box-containing protein [Rhodopseudomonas thermotolerans]SSW89893.1 PAS domain S-box-containing protein [Rhodopseudomonas pentothenatexigens]